MLVALLFAHLALAADDAPIAPVGYTIVPDAQRVNEGKALVACAEERVHLQDAVKAQHEGTIAVPWVIVLVVASVAVGAGVTVGGLAAAGKLK